MIYVPGMANICFELNIMLDKGQHKYNKIYF